MKLYDMMIKHLLEMTEGADQEKKEYKGDSKNRWPENDAHEMVFQKEMAYELGGNGLPAVNITCMTSDESLVTGDEILVIGPDLDEIRSDTPYARIAILLTEDMEHEDTDSVYQSLQDMDLVKYHIFPKGFMIRTSGQSGREQVRVAKSAVDSGLNFEKTGNLYIEHYKATGKVRRAKIIFVTDPGADYKALEETGKKTAEIKNSLSRFKGGLETDCSVCDIKDICSEVEGLRELHFGTKDRQKRGIGI